LILNIHLPTIRFEVLSAVLNHDSEYHLTISDDGKRCCDILEFEIEKAKIKDIACYRVENVTRKEW